MKNYEINTQYKISSQGTTKKKKKNTKLLRNIVTGIPENGEADTQSIQKNGLN